MMTISERQFMDLYVREGFLHDYDGPAHQAARARGIAYDHLARLWPVYRATWRVIGKWPDHLPPVVPEPPCPWESARDLEIRTAELLSRPTPEPILTPAECAFMTHFNREYFPREPRAGLRLAEGQRHLARRDDRVPVRPAEAGIHALAPGS